MSKEAMKLALEALAVKFSEGWHEGIKIDASDIMLLNDAAQALAEQPAQQEPVAWGIIASNTGRICQVELDADEVEGHNPKHIVPLYTSPPAQPQQEPVVWMYVNKSTHETKFQKHMRDFVDHSLWSEVPLYGEPLANHEFQCVCGAVWCGDEMVHLPDKRPQPSKPWVGLTQQDIDIAFDDTQEGGGFNEFARDIEAKLKEKNNG